MPSCCSRPGNPPNAPPPSTNNVFPWGDTTNKESPWPTSRMVVSNFPADQTGAKGNSATTSEHVADIPERVRTVVRRAEKTTRAASPNMAATEKKTTTSQKGGPG